MNWIKRGKRGKVIYASGKGTENKECVIEADVSRVDVCIQET